jgi:transcriptional regulator NrdR family protein
MPDVLFSDVLAALKNHKDRYIAAREITSTAIQSLLKDAAAPSFTPSQISEAAAQVLKRFDKSAWLRYTADHPSLQG